MPAVDRNWSQTHLQLPAVIGASIYECILVSYCDVVLHIRLLDWCSPPLLKHLNVFESLLAVVVASLAPFPLYIYVGIPPLYFMLNRPFSIASCDTKT